MLRVVANLRRVGGGHGHHLNHVWQSTLVGHAAAIPAPLWCHRIRQHSLVATNPHLVFLRSGLHGAPHHLSMPKSSSSSVRGFAISSTASSSGASQSGFTAWYLRMLDKHSLPTKCVTAANILAFADMTAQYLANVMVKECEPKEAWDKMRTLRMLGIGAFFSAPILHMWFYLMQWAIPKTDVASAIKKVLLGQIVASPVVNSAFFAVNTLLQGLHYYMNEMHVGTFGYGIYFQGYRMQGKLSFHGVEMLGAGESGDEAIEKIKRDLWPILDFITFRYVPIHLQVFFNNCCSFIWTIYLTSMAGKKAAAPSTEKLAHS